MEDTDTTDLAASAPPEVTNVYSPGWVPLAPAPAPPHFNPAKAPPLPGLPPYPPEARHDRPRWLLWLAALAIVAALVAAGLAVASAAGTEARIVPTDEPAPAVEVGEGR